MDESTQQRIEEQKSICLKYASVFEGREGKDVLADLKAHCDADGLMFAPDPRVEAFNLGARSVYLYIKERLSMEALKRMNLQLGNEASVSVNP